jgi:hypothetical protein
LAFALLIPLFSSCQKTYKKEDLIGTWAYQENTKYTITFKEDGTLGYTAPGDTPYYTPTYTVDGIFIYIRVMIGSAAVNDVVEIRSLTPTTLVIFYDGDLLFDGESLTGEYVLLRK